MHSHQYHHTPMRSMPPLKRSSLTYTFCKSLTETHVVISRCGYSVTLEHTKPHKHVTDIGIVMHGDSTIRGSLKLET